MKKTTIEVEALLKWGQAHLTRESVFLYPNPQVILQASATDFWDFVIEQTGMSGPDELNAFLDQIQGPESDA